MCIAILNTKSPLKREYIANSWANNEQGAGLLYVEDKVLKVFKTYKEKEFTNFYYKIRAKIDTPIVLHFRIATSGYEKYTNLHPFLVSPNLGFVHNGIIPGIGDNRYSDTYYFNTLLQGFKHDFLNCESTMNLISNYIGNSKLVFLDDQNKYHIINEDMGIWDGEDWFSNSSYLSYNDYSWFGNTKRMKTNQGKFKFYETQTDIEELGIHDLFVNTTETNIQAIELLTDVSRYDLDFMEMLCDAEYECGSNDLYDIYYQIESQINPIKA